MRNGNREACMSSERKMCSVRSAGIDYFRMAAAFMVIAIHIAPFSYWNRDLDFLLTYCLFRVAVPFFFMTTGYFVLAPYVKSGFRRKRSFYKFMVKNTALYLAVTALYLPLTIYSGNLPQGFSGSPEAPPAGPFCLLSFSCLLLLFCTYFPRFPAASQWTHLRPYRVIL